MHCHRSSCVLVIRCAVIWITRRGTHRVSAGAIVRVPAADALALANAGHQLTAAQGRPGRANSGACGRGARARATARRKAGGWCCQRQHRCKRDRRTQSSQIYHCCSILGLTPPSVIPPRPVSTARPKPPAGRVSGNFGPASRQTSDIPVTSFGRLITSACDEGEGMGAAYWTSRAVRLRRVFGMAVGRPNYGDSAFNYRSAGPIDEL
jgi:hypothetical protein